MASWYRIVGKTIGANLNGGDVFVIDEGGMVSSRQLARFIWRGGGARRRSCSSATMGSYRRSGRRTVQGRRSAMPSFRKSAGGRASGGGRHRWPRINSTAISALPRAERMRALLLVAWAQANNS
ncbi:hypothetical protein [Sinorhizobium meliloti]|uniref:hypothetical protein n=1 Tax=Rhizobium meliloti TaxID=382 RepID=UPI00399BF91D